uniref:Uncharacterized protein n=1 Tax=Oryza nivara TaxID=4536 RepID=A0A0E0GK55_ORYNI
MHALGELPALHCFPEKAIRSFPLYPEDVLAVLANGHNKQKVEPRNIIIRQRGTHFHPGNYVGMGKDHTLFCLKEGHVRFERNKLTGRKWVHVDPVAGHVLHPVYASDSTPAAEMEPL